MKKNDNQKISDLKRVIDLGQKLKKDTTPDEAKLRILENKQKNFHQNEQKKETEKNHNQILIKQEVKTKENTNNFNIDKQNLIQEISKDDNKIVVKFNKNIDKSYINHKGIKKDNIYEYIFEINGKYKPLNPVKLSIDGIDNVLTSNTNNSTIIKIQNSSKPKISFMLKTNELLIMAEGNNEIAKKEFINQNVNSSQNENNVNNEDKFEQNIDKKEKDAVEDEPFFLNKKVSSNSKKKVIVIDAGHGGDDVGAIGPDKRYEKVINFEVTKYLYSILKQRGYSVYLTRSNDRFIKVMDRTILANDKNADLFISIHTNAMPKEKANSTSGIETFFLSPARSERAKRVAALENKDDIREMNESSKSAFLESLNRPRITASHKFAIDVQAGLLQSTRTKYKDVKDTGVKEGPFWVLVGAQMPSILIELGFISHPEESRRLYEKSYQQLLANGIANGIDSYFSKNP